MAAPENVFPNTMNCVAAKDEQNEKLIIRCPVYVNDVAACRLRPTAVCHAPEQAASALAEALSQQNEAALSKVLGDNWQQFLPTDGIDPSAVDRFQRDWQVKHVIVQQGDNAWLDVGSEAWRLPVPIVKTSEGWRFDMAAGEE